MFPATLEPGLYFHIIFYAPIMARYEVDGKVVDFSSLTFSQVNQLLAPLKGIPGKIFCLCSSPKQPVHVSRRDGNHFPVKEANKGSQHHKLCRHHSLTAPEAASMGYTLEAIHSSGDDEELVVSFSQPLVKGTKPTAPTDSEYAFKKGTARPTTNRMTELGLLHLLWERARLNEQHPRMLIGSPWPEVHRAAFGVKPGSLRGLKYGLSDLLLLPLHPETANQADRNYAKFKTAQKKGRFVLYVARLSPAQITSLLAAETSDFSLKGTFNVNLSLYADCARPVLDRLNDSFSAELSFAEQGDDLIALGVAQPDGSKNYAKISSMVLMPVTGGHLPYDSGHERQLILELLRQNRWFKKPLRYEAKRDMQVHPDFVLLDTPEPVVIEVYGMNTPEYRARKDEKQLIYSSEEYPYECWSWDAAQCGDLARWLHNHALPGQR